MSDNIKIFVAEHKHEFDTDEPAKELWNKINAKIEAKISPRISSNRLSKFKHLAFSASVLIVAVYFIFIYPGNSSSNSHSANRKDSANINSKLYSKVYSKKSALHVNETRAEKEGYDVTDSKKNPESKVKSIETNFSELEEIKPETTFQIATAQEVKTSANLVKEKTEVNLAGNIRKPGLFIPEEPEQMNTYTGTLYEAPTFRMVLRAYKFPGKVKLDKGAGISNEDENYRTTLRTVSCIHLARKPNIKAIWIKGKTDKEITLSIKKQFKNIILLKKDGRELHPEAISHYYPGLGVLSEFKGRYFNMVFKDKVELILFFKDAEEGDKIVIDRIVETMVKAQP